MREHLSAYIVWDVSAQEIRLFFLYLFSHLYEDGLMDIYFTLWVIFYFILFIYLIYSWLRWAFIAARGLSLVASSGGLLFVAVRGLLIAVASLVVEHGL